MDINSFKDKVMMPPVPPMEEPVEEETPEHPNTPVLENLMLNEDKKFGENNQILEHILMKLEDNSDKTVEEHTLVKIADVVDELKSVKDELVKLNEPWDIKLNLI
jgi:hypothetical protein